MSQPQVHHITHPLIQHKLTLLRDKRTPMVVSPTPFTPNRYYRG